MIQMDHNQWLWNQSTVSKTTRVKAKANTKARTRASVAAGFRGNPMVVEKKDTKARIKARAKVRTKASKRAKETTKENKAIVRALIHNSAKYAMVMDIGQTNARRR